MERANSPLNAHCRLADIRAITSTSTGWDVWGVTARILVQFLELVYGFEIKKIS